MLCLLRGVTLALLARPDDDRVVPKMRRATVVPGGVLLTEVERPSPLSGEVLVRSRTVGICGSDVHAAQRRHPFISLPYNPGHEVVGEVTELGEGVSGVRVGDRVIVEPTLPCWTCKSCLSSRPNLCEKLRFFGCVHDQGGLADYFTISADRTHRLPAELTDLQAVLIEPLATAVHACALAGDLRGRTVGVLGAGTIGLLVLQVARHLGARRIVVTDLLLRKRQLALALGADAVVDAGSGDVPALIRAELGESADVVFDCVSSQTTVDQAVRSVFKGGTVIIVGVPAAPATVALPQVQNWQVRVQGSATYVSADFRSAADLIRSRVVRPEDVVTAVYELNDVAAAFAAAAGGLDVKVVVDCLNQPAHRQ